MAPRRRSRPRMISAGISGDEHGTLSQGGWRSGRSGPAGSGGIPHRSELVPPGSSLRIRPRSPRAGRLPHPSRGRDSPRGHRRSRGSGANPSIIAPPQRSASREGWRAIRPARRMCRGPPEISVIAEAPEHNAPGRTSSLPEGRARRQMNREPAHPSVPVRRLEAEAELESRIGIRIPRAEEPRCPAELQIGRGHHADPDQARG